MHCLLGIVVCWIGVNVLVLGLAHRRFRHLRRIEEQQDSQTAG